MRYLIFLIIFLFLNNSFANDVRTNDFKNTIYNLVKIQYYKDLQNSSSINYFTYRGDKSLAACLDWTKLTDHFLTKKKYFRNIIWGSSFGENSSTEKALKHCKRKSLKEENCTCGLVDNDNINSVIIPENILAKIGSGINPVANNDQDEQLAKLKKIYDDDLISKEEYDNKRKEILGIIDLAVSNNLSKNDDNVSTTKIIRKDSIGPKIIIANSFEADENLIALINGSVTDESDIVEVTVDDDEVSFKNGKFTHQLFVKPGGQSVLITAMDKFGNQSYATIELKRAKIKITTKKYDYLNPTLIKSKINASSVALIIGIENYENTFSAPFAKNDALAFNDFVHYSFGVPRQNIKLLMNNEAGRTDTLKAISKSGWLPKIVKENETDIYIFFSGHGLASEDGEDLYLLPADGDPDLLEDSSLLRNQIFNRISKLNPRSVTVFLDTCYSGATRSDEFLVAAKPIFIEAEEQDIPAKFTVFSASAGRETAKVLQEAEHGLFSYYMMKGLEGEADINSDNQITNGELIAFINKNVSRQANQTPQLKGDPDQVLVQW